MHVTVENVADVFTYHRPGSDDLDAFQSLRDAGREFAEVILDVCPLCADQQAAIRLVREAVMTANAAIALGGKI
jgi:hypothetical protein